MESTLDRISKKVPEAESCDVIDSAMAEVTQRMETGDDKGTYDVAVFCWGSNEEHQLPLTDSTNETHVLTPSLIPSLDGKKIQVISCGEKHTAFLQEDGVLCTCGSNSDGQLGQTGPTQTPGVVDVLSTQVVDIISCGNKHCVAVTDTGQVFSWGNNEWGQLGRGFTDDTFITTPKLVRNLSSSRVCQLVCGHHHCVALTDDGYLYGWGHNKYGQLGLGNFNDKFCIPQHVKSLDRVAIRQIACGAYHTFALTTSGALFGWGNNSYHAADFRLLSCLFQNSWSLPTSQATAVSCSFLTESLSQYRFYPTLVKTLRSQRVKYVTCGDEHTAVITEEGGVFTFGSGQFGQLGHNSTNSELLPRKVFELMGTTVTQISCGSNYTAAYVPSNGQIYSFGQGANGQLGTNTTTNRHSPSTVVGPFVPVRGRALATHFSLENKPSYTVRKLFCGGNQCFVTVTKPQLEILPDDYREADAKHQIMALSEDTIKRFVTMSTDARLDAEVLDEAEKLFSSVSCLNASFLLTNDEHFHCSSKHPGIDMDAARDGFGRLRSLPNECLSQWITNVITDNLIPSLNDKMPDIEALRIYLTLPWCHLFDEPHTYDTVICPFGKSVIKLQDAASKIIDNWWSKFDAEYLLRLVDIYKQTVWYILCLESPKNASEVAQRQDALHACMEMLKKINKVNEANNYIISYDSLYIPELTEKLDIRADFINWIQQVRGGHGILAQKGRLLSFCNYPFVFDAQAKTILLQTDTMLQMQLAVDEVNRRNLSTLIMPTINPVNPCLILYVTRDNIVGDTIAQLAKQGNCDLKKPMKVMFIGEEALDAGGVRKVIFMGEEAVDEGGVRKEFFLLLLREILDPKYGMFVYHDDSRLLWFSHETFEDNVMFGLIGVLCGLAIYNSLIIDISFPLALYKKLLKRPIALEDLKELQPSIGRSMEQLLAYDGDDFEETFCLSFEVIRESYGEVKHINLIPDGANIPVTKENRQQYIDVFLDDYFNSSVKDQFQAFYEGFHRVCGGRVLELFHPKELQAMVVGNEHYDWDQLEKNCVYKGAYFHNHTTIINFWQVFREMSLQDKKKFLLFLTGSDRIPIHGMKVVKMVIQPTGGGDEFLPVAHTCFNLLDLPKYSTKEVLRDKLLQAIQHTEGFGIV